MNDVQTEENLCAVVTTMAKPMYYKAVQDTGTSIRLWAFNRRNSAGGGEGIIEM